METLDKHRDLLRLTARGLTDEQAARSTTVSALCVGGLIKHVAVTEERWMRFATGDATAVGGTDDRANEFRFVEGDTLDGVLKLYDDVARHTDELVRTLPDLDAAYPLPPAPWFPPGARWSVRRVLLHLIAETAQHAGHADIVREAIDGQKSMG